MSMKSSPIESQVEYHVYGYDVSNLEGRLLTQLDASISDVVQRKALKDLVRSIVWDWVYYTKPPIVASGTGSGTIYGANARGGS